MINKFGMQQACNEAIKYVSDNSATILTYLGTIGVISTAVMSAKAVPKAQLLLEEKAEFKMNEYGEPLTKFEKMLAVVPAYVPALLMGTATIACIIGSNHINKQEQAALYSAYAYLNCSFNEYREKVKTLFGEDKEKEVRDAIALDKMTEIDGCYEYPEDNMSIYDEWGRRYFTISKNDFQKAIYDINRMYSFNGEMTLNNLYEFLNLEPIPGGDYMGWSALKDFECRGVAWIDIKLTPLDMIDNHEVFVMEFNVNPSNDFYYWSTSDFC